MKKITVILLFIGLIISFGLTPSCKKETECRNNLFISSINPTYAFTGQKVGTVSIAVTGDTAGVMFSLNNGSFQTSPDFGELEPGSFVAEVKNAKGCTNSLDFEVPASDPCVTIPITVAATKTDPFTGQSTGTITARAEGGSDFSYKLNNGAPVQSGLFANLAAGTYTVTATNSYGCSSTTQITLTGVDPCTVITVNADYTKVDPFNNLANGSITASARNNPSNLGGDPFMFRLNTGAFSANATFSNLAAGTYQITARNSYNCTGVISVTLVNNINCASRVFSVSGTAAPVIPCITPSTGSITVTNPVATYRYNLTQNGAEVRAYSTSTSFNNLSAGNYVINVRDPDGCTRASSTITVTTASAGPNFTAVKNLLTSSKRSNASCHQGTMSLSSSDCLIVSKGSSIYNRTIVTTNPSLKMPPATTLTTAERNAIIAWFNSDFRYNN